MRQTSLLTQILLQQESQPPSLVSSRDSIAGRGVRKLYSGKRLQVCSAQRLMTQGNWGQTKLRQSIMCNCWGAYVVSLIGLRSRIKNQINWKLLNPGPFDSLLQRQWFTFQAIRSCKSVFYFHIPLWRKHMSL